MGLQGKKLGITACLKLGLHKSAAPRYRFNIEYRISNTMKRTNIDNIVFFANIRPLFDHLSNLSPIQYSTDFTPVEYLQIP